ncbi:OmpA family protein [Mucilaginibacter mali]|uniref:OmpA family protein n=1 Tax=Mucilaginibacter mali TaxID=2740462 RepID=A0A7D4QMR1_9SPHI|nr:OmpA family protein [Mucilaginibacter mali]QKJ32010.1 OmpA family protein [Mucilaginibacter mali]
MIRYILVFLLVLVLGSPLYAQELTSRRAQADRLFDRAEYFKSLNLYLKLAEIDNPQVAVLERVADCYRLMNNYEQAEDWYSRLSNTKGINPQDIFYYAEVLLRNKKIDKAREQYRRFFATNGTPDLLNVKLATCDSAATWMKQEGNYKVTNEKKINSVYSDWGPFYHDKTGIYFTSDRSTNDYKGDKGIYARTGTEWLKLFNYDFKTGYSTEILFGSNSDAKPVKFKGGYSNEFDNKEDDINLSKDYHTGPICINATGDTAYITVTTRLGKSSLPDVSTPFDQHLYIRRLELMIATKKNNKWNNFKRFPYDNVSSYSVGHAALSKNGQILYFTSDMPGGIGKTDIWYCQKTSDGKWGKPVNCGNVINTAADEAFPSIGGDDKLYFASRGLPGMGGYDIFSARGSGSAWTKPVNLKYPLNSTSDDFCFITNDGKTGYMSSDRQGGQGNDDIYSFIFTGKDDEETIASNINAPVNAVNMPPMAMGAPVMRPSLAAPAGEVVPPANVPVATPMTVPAKMVTLEGGVFDNNTKQGLDSVYITLKSATGETIGTDMVMRNKRFSFRVPPGQDYTIEASRKGFYPTSQKVSLKSGPVTSVNTNLQMTVEPLALGKTFVIRNIYYDLNRATIRPDAIEELQRLVEFMKDNPSVRIELSSHTDSRGPDNYNMLLSEARATSAVNYLRHHGIAVNRMVAKGYGETRLLNDCGNGVKCSEEDHQFNRRTEIRIIGGTFK